MADKRDPLHLLAELRWRADITSVAREWEAPGGHTPAEEFFCILFDDLLIEEAADLYALAEGQRTIIKSISTHLNAVSSRHGVRFNVQKLLLDEDFLRAQELSALL